MSSTVAKRILRALKTNRDDATMSVLIPRQTVRVPIQVDMSDYPPPLSARLGVTWYPVPFAGGWRTEDGSEWDQPICGISFTEVTVQRDVTIPMETLMQVGWEVDFMEILRTHCKIETHIAPSLPGRLTLSEQDAEAINRATREIMDPADSYHDGSEWI